MGDRIRISVDGVGKMDLPHFTMINARPRVETIACDATGFLVDVLSKNTSNPIHTRHDAVVIAPPRNCMTARSAPRCNCLLFQQVTIAGGARIGGHVDVGAGAKVLGPSVVRNHVQIGANAVVKGDLADGAVAVDIPARIISMEPLPQD
jgi:acetyltransferase-like isoleucine patch superfamily enzyme